MTSPPKEDLESGCDSKASQDKFDGNGEQGLIAMNMATKMEDSGDSNFHNNNNNDSSSNDAEDNNGMDLHHKEPLMDKEKEVNKWKY